MPYWQYFSHVTAGRERERDRERERVYLCIFKKVIFTLTYGLVLHLNGKGYPVTITMEKKPQRPNQISV